MEISLFINRHVKSWSPFSPMEVYWFLGIHCLSFCHNIWTIDCIYEWINFWDLCSFYCQILISKICFIQYVISSILFFLSPCIIHQRQELLAGNFFLQLLHKFRWCQKILSLFLSKYQRFSYINFHIFTFLILNHWTNNISQKVYVIFHFFQIYLGLICLGIFILFQKFIKLFHTILQFQSFSFIGVLLVLLVQLFYQIHIFVYHIILSIYIIWIFRLEFVYQILEFLDHFLIILSQGLIHCLFIFILFFHSGINLVMQFLRNFFLGYLFQEFFSCGFLTLEIFPEIL